MTPKLRDAKTERMLRLNPYDRNEFRKPVKYLTKRKSPPPNLSHGTVASTSLEKTSMLNTFFGNCFNHRVSPLDFQDMDQLEPFSCCPDDLLCSVEEIQWLLVYLDTSKSNSPDGISASTLKLTAPSIGLDILC